MQKQLDNLYVQLTQVEDVIRESQLEYREYAKCFPQLEPGEVYDYFLKKVAIIIQKYARRRLAMKRLTYMKSLLKYGEVLRAVNPFYNTNFYILNPGRCPRTHKALYLIYTCLHRFRLNCYYGYKARTETAQSLKSNRKSRNQSRIKQLHQLKAELCYDLSSD